ncbi:MAG: 30S ribosomal protein S8 [Verrucomicrobia bacterium]|nr:30S ribosomal protein S8 [Verrucomicrobiota bacterium]
MSMTDPIADFLTRIRNANRAGKPDVEASFSRLKAGIARVLKQNGYIADFYAEKKESGQQVLKVQLKIVGNERAIVGIRRASKPGLRRYVGVKEMPRVLSGMGVAILTTSRGVMSGQEAKKANLGGEVLAYVW